MDAVLPMRDIKVLTTDNPLSPKAVLNHPLKLPQTFARNYLVHHLQKDPAAFPQRDDI
jgi:hypothetical protein